MTRRPLLLDLFCGAGGAAKGYHDAGFDIIGVDNRPQPRYPYPFIQADAMTYDLDGYDAIHASPPCQAYAVAAQSQRNAGKVYPDLLAATRDRLNAAGVPWIIENVPGAPMRADLNICGCQGRVRPAPCALVRNVVARVRTGRITQPPLLGPVRRGSWHPVTRP